MKDKKTKGNRPVEKSCEDIMFNEAGSANDCTGLIPKAVLNEDEYQSYEEISDFDLPGIYRQPEK